MAAAHDGRGEPCVDVTIEALQADPTTNPGSGRGRSAPWRDGAVLALALGGVGLTILAARGTDLSAMTDLGLASVLPMSYWVALVLISCAFALALARDPIRETLLAIPAGALGIAVFGLTAIASVVPRDHVSLRHVGIIDHLASSGRIDGSIDAYFNWPGFFSVGAFLSRAFGDPDLLPMARWAPLVARLMLIAALLLLMRALLRDRRAAWVGVWIAMLWDWVDQDYFAPQTFDLVLHLVLLALVAEWLLVDRAGDPVPSDGRRQRLGVYVVAIGLGLALIPAHQLTPIVTALTLVALALVRRLPHYGLPVVISLGIAVWLVTGAGRYVAGHDLVTVPNLEMLAAAGVSSRVAGSALHHFVVMERMALSAALWLLAALGFARALRAGKPVLVPAVLAAVPFALLPMQAYGGEMPMRVHMFALPGMAVLAVRLLAPPEGNRVRSAVAVLFVSLLVLPALIVARFGNDRIEIHTPGEIAAVDALYRAVPKGGLLIAPSPVVPWRDHDYTDYRYATLVNLAQDATQPTQVWDSMLGQLKRVGAGGVVITESSYAYAEMLGDVVDLSSIEWGLANDKQFTMIYDGADGRVYLYRPKDSTHG